MAKFTQSESLRLYEPETLCSSTHQLKRDSMFKKATDGCMHTQGHSSDFQSTLDGPG